MMECVRNVIPILFPWSVDTDEKFELLQWNSDKLVFQTVEEYFEEYYLVSTQTLAKINPNRGNSSRITSLTMFQIILFYLFSPLV